MSNLSNKIKELRLDKGISQQDLAKNIGVAKSVAYYWENGVNEPKASYIKLLANFFDVSTDYLLGNEEPWQEPQNTSQKGNITTSPQLTPEEQTLLDAFREFTPGRKKALFDMLDIGQEENIKKNKNHTK